MKHDRETIKNQIIYVVANSAMEKTPAHVARFVRLFSNAPSYKVTIRRFVWMVGVRVLLLGFSRGGRSYGIL